MSSAVADDPAGDPAPEAEEVAAAGDVEGDRELSAGEEATAGDEDYDEEDYDEDDDEEEEEDEPLLKYQRLGASVQDLLVQDGASCVSVSDKVLAVGTCEGRVLVFDSLGFFEIKRFDAHGATVNDIGFDQGNEYVASCSDDGTVVVTALYSDEVIRQSYGRPVKCVALDPSFRVKKSRQFVSGGLAGQLILNAKGWLGNKDYALHGGEGTIHSVRWHGSLIAWANDIGVRIHDCVSHQCIKYVNRPKGSPRADLFRASLFWQGESLLVVGWGDSVTILRISVQESPLSPPPGASGADGGAMASSAAMGGAGGSLPVFRHVSIAASFQTDYYISGIAPFGSDLVVLAYVMDRDDDTVALASPQSHEDMQRRRSSSAAAARAAPPPPLGAGSRSPSFAPSAVRPGQQAPASLRPEVRIVTWMNEELASDALTIHGYEHYRANDYMLASFYPSQASHASSPFEGKEGRDGREGEAGAGGGGGGGEGAGAHTIDEPWWTEGNEPMYYIVSPKDIVLGRPRDADDRIQWLLENKMFVEAMAVLESGKNLKEATREQIGQEYLTHLFQERDYAKAASLCPTLLFGKTALWERWVLEFAKVQQLAALCRYIPVASPLLRPAVYDMVLKIFLQSDHSNFLFLVQTWPPAVYSIKEITDALLAFEARNTAGASQVLREALAELYVLQGRRDHALGIYLQLQRPGVFDFISKNNLFTSIEDKVHLLVQLNSLQAVSLLVDHHDQIAPQTVVLQMREAARAAEGRDKTKWRLWLHQYLHHLFELHPSAGAKFHALQIELYAEFEPKLLMNFLTSSNAYPLEFAYKVCEKNGLVQELVFILGRMGNTREALHLIMERLGDIPQAIEFVRSQGDDELWDLLISMSMSSPRMVGGLLENVGGHLNPLRLIHRIPRGMPIPELRDRLIKIITDSRTQASLIEGCREILKADRVVLSTRLYWEAKRRVGPGRVSVVAANKM